MSNLHYLIAGLALGAGTLSGFAVETIQSGGVWYALDDATKTASVAPVPKGETRYSETVTIAETVTGPGDETYTVVAIGEAAFGDSNITGVVLPATLKTIGNRAFFNCQKLGAVELPSQLTAIGSYAFQACHSLKSITVPASVTELGNNAFYACFSLTDVNLQTSAIKSLNATFERCVSLASITIPEGVETLNGTFDGCEKLTQVNLPSSLRTIKEFAFSGTILSELVVPEGVTEVGYMGIANMNGEWNSNTTLKSVTLPGSLATINYNAFNNDCALSTLVIENAETALSVGDPGNAYYNAQWLATPDDISGVVPLTNLVLRRDVKDVDGYYEDFADRIFNRKTTLKNVTFGGSLTRTPALTDCKDIETITMETGVPPVCGGFAQEVYDNATLNIPEGSFGAYAEAEGWKEFAMFRNRATILVNGLGDGETLELANMGTLLIEPTNSVTGEKYGKGQYSVTFADESVATLYSNVNTIVAHWPGETTMTISAGEEILPATFTIRVADVDPADRPADFREGMAWLNEEWMGHTSGSINFIDPEGKLYARAYGNQNGNMAFGATTTQAVYYADKLFVMSKQPWDGGDTRPLKSGGRVVVADAKDYRHIAAFDNIGGDGRSVVGVNPGKVYLGHTNGVRAMYINGDEITLAESDIEGIEMPRNSQVGDMLKAGNYVFVVIPNSSLIIIDSETDKVVNTVEMKKIQALAQTIDGRVWIGCSKTLQPVDPETLEFGEVYNIGAGEISCTPGSWRPGNLKASVNSNTLLWSTVGNWSSKGDLVRWDIDKVSDPSTLTAIYTHDMKAGTGSQAYGAPGYDSNTDTWMFATNNGFGVNSMYNWLHFVDATTGELKHTIKLPDYFWFPSQPVNTDCYEPELDGFDLIELESDEDPISFDLVPTDKDNLDCNISLTLLDGDAAQSDAETQEDAEKAATVTLEGRRLTVTPLAEGSRFLHLEIESNGRTVTKEIEVKVNRSTGIDAVETELDADAIYYRLDGIRINGLPDQPGVYLESKAGAVRKVIVR